jgi:hypothetical protein
MTSFFIGGLKSRDPGAEEAYAELREFSSELAGCPARMRRIFKLRCRLQGHDEEIEVGKPLLHGDMVRAIMDHGRHEAFVVHTAPSDGTIGEPLRVSNPVYGVTEFSATD